MFVDGLVSMSVDGYVSIFFSYVSHWWSALFDLISICMSPSWNLMHTKSVNYAMLKSLFQDMQSI